MPCLQQLEQKLLTAVSTLEMTTGTGGREQETHTPGALWVKVMFKGKGQEH